MFFVLFICIIFFYKTKTKYYNFIVIYKIIIFLKYYINNCKTSLITTTLFGRIKM